MKMDMQAAIKTVLIVGWVKKQSDEPNETDYKILTRR
jgi:hypothetical protein